MSCSKIETMISSYLDNELPKEEEAFLFTHISSCPECREEFKKQNLINHKIQSRQIEVPPELDSRIFDTLKGRKSPAVLPSAGRPVLSYLNYFLSAVIVMLIIFSIVQLTQNANYQTQLRNVETQIEKQNKLINSLILNPNDEEKAPNLIKPIIIKSTRL